MPQLVRIPHGMTPVAMSTAADTGTSDLLTEDNLVLTTEAGEQIETES